MSQTDTGIDLIDRYRLRTTFRGESTEHHRYISDRARGVRRLTEVKRWQRVKEIGHGGFGEVFLEKERSGDVRAVKEIRKQRYRSTSSDYLRELLAMAYFSMEEATFVHLEGWYEDVNKIYIAMEYLELGDLHQNVSGPMPEGEAKVIVLQLVEALEFMHQKCFAHRDLKPSNVFVVNRSPNWWVKLADFGVSKRVRGENTAYHTSLIGDYVAPEIFDLIDDEDLEDNSTYTTAVDMWSLGCLSYWLLATQTPFPGRKGLRLYCRGKSPFPSQFLRDQNLDDAGILFIERLMAVLPQKRLSASDARSDLWLESVREPAVGLRRRVSVEISDTESAVQLRDRSSGSSGSSVRSYTLAEVAPNDDAIVKSAVTIPTASQHAKTIDTSATDINGLITSPGKWTSTIGNDSVDRIKHDTPFYPGGSAWFAGSIENLHAPSRSNATLEKPTQEERHLMASQLQSNALQAGQDNLADTDSLGAKVYDAKWSGNTDPKGEGKSLKESLDLMQEGEVTDEVEEDLESERKSVSVAEPGSHNALVPRKAHVEDGPDEYVPPAVSDAPPAVSAQPVEPVNVFEYSVNEDRDKRREDVAAPVETVPGGGQPDSRTIDAPTVPRFPAAAKTFDVDTTLLPNSLWRTVFSLASLRPEEGAKVAAGQDAVRHRSTQGRGDASKPREVEEHVPLRQELALSTTGPENTRIRDEVQQDVQNDKPSEVDELVKYQIAAKPTQQEHRQVRDEVHADAQNEEDMQVLNAESRHDDFLLATTNTIDTSVIDTSVIDTSVFLGNMDGNSPEPEMSGFKLEARMAQSRAERMGLDLIPDQNERPLGAASQNAPSEDQNMPPSSPVGEPWPAIQQVNAQRPEVRKNAYSSPIPLGASPRPVNGSQMGQRSELREGSGRPAAIVSALNSSPRSSSEALNDWLFPKDSSATHEGTVEACVQKLSEAGFSREESQIALERHDHNIAQAVIYSFSKTQQTGTTGNIQPALRRP